MSAAMLLVLVLGTVYVVGWGVTAGVFWRKWETPFAWWKTWWREWRNLPE